MTTEPTLQTRRALLVGAAAAGASWLAGLVGRAEPVSAANGASVILGSSTNSASASTTVTTTAGTGVSGTGPIGISGTSNNATSTNAGVFGTAAGATNYGVFSNGKLGTTGPLELTQLSITTYTLASGKAFLYVKAGTTAGTTELHVKFPSGVDKLITSG